MSRPLVLVCLLLVLVGLAGCQQVRCASDTVVASAGSAWRGVKGALTPAATPSDPACRPLADPVYSHPCGGDNDLGRGGTGAFRMP